MCYYKDVTSKDVTIPFALGVVLILPSLQILTIYALFLNNEKK
nr:MAG TPA: hypothetical protein [Caudoviricetes sp.]